MKSRVISKIFIRMETSSIEKTKTFADIANETRLMKRKTIFEFSHETGNIKIVEKTTTIKSIETPNGCYASVQALPSHSDLVANKERRQRLCVKRNPVIEAVNNGPDNGSAKCRAPAICQTILGIG